MSWFINKVWYGTHPLKWFLFPFSLLYLSVVYIRRHYLVRFCQIDCPVPLIVVGNLTVGGAGKTPLVIELANKLQLKELTVGIVSRGYGAKVNHFPHEVHFNDSASLVGDEALLMARKTGCPVVIAPNRAEAVAYLLKNHAIQIILSDDGMQHYRMGRSIEILVIDGARGLGNGMCLPAGPLREGKSRLQDVDFIVVNGGPWPDAYSMTLIPGKITQLSTGKGVLPGVFSKGLTAVAGIGNPERFFSSLRQLGLTFTSFSYPDHYQFRMEDLNYSQSVIMTEKDAVKCESFGADNLFYLPVNASLDDGFWNALWSHQQLKGYC